MKTVKTISIEPELYNNINKLAERDSRSFSSYLTQILVAHWDEYKQEVQEELEKEGVHHA